MSDEGTVAIRRATAADLDTVLGLFLAAGIDDRRAGHAHAALSFQRLQACGGTVWLAEWQGRAAGTLTCFVLPLLAHQGAPAALVEDVVVHPQLQGRGIGRRLMQHAMAVARQHGCYKLALSSNQKRQGAHAFYERLGFRRHGVSFAVDLA